jgi:DNA-binding beta-propeller fold protein YncE
VAPDGRTVYVSDRLEPVVHVLDAETRKEVRRIDLPGVRPGATFSDAETKYTWAQWAPCSLALACTPDGKSVLVLSNAGLQVIETATGTVVRTLPELRDAGLLAVSFDGKRAFISTNDWRTRGSHSIVEWARMSLDGVGGGLALLDLQTWQVTKTRATGGIGGIAVKPDDSQVYYSAVKEKTLHAVNPSTLEDMAVVPLASATATRFTPRGVAVLPDGSKAYVVCADTSASGPRTADEFFCAVVRTETNEVIKRIPLQAY